MIKKSLDCLMTFFSALLFSAGLTMSGMINPEKVKSFLDVTGNWDPSLIYVMMGAVLVNLVLFHFILKRNSPMLAASFSLPSRKDIDGKLVAGAALFGIGWGITGICPGPALANLFSGNLSFYLYLGGMLIGMGLFEIYNAHAKEKLGDL